MTIDNKKKPWMKWYTSDWRGEPTLRMVSRAARSLWVDLLGLMWESPLIGYLYVNSRKPSEADLARILGDRPEDLSALVNELREAGVFSETDEGVIYSRKMVRDAQISEKGRADVQKRGGAWSPGKKPVTPISDPKTTPNSPPNRDPITNILDARLVSKCAPEKVNSEQKVNKKVNEPVPLDMVPDRPGGDLSPMQALVRRLCDAMGTTPDLLMRRGGFTGPAFAAQLEEWKARGCDPDADIWPVIAKAAARAKARGALISSPRYFEIAIFEARDNRLACLPTPAEAKAAEYKKFDEGMSAYMHKGWWHETMGPRPDEPGCKVPPEILNKHLQQKHAATH